MLGSQGAWSQPTLCNTTSVENAMQGAGNLYDDVANPDERHLLDKLGPPGLAHDGLRWPHVAYSDGLLTVEEYCALETADRSEF